MDTPTQRYLFVALRYLWGRLKPSRRSDIVRIRVYFGTIGWEFSLNHRVTESTEGAEALLYGYGPSALYPSKVGSDHEPAGEGKPLCDSVFKIRDRTVAMKFSNPLSNFEQHAVEARLRAEGRKGRAQIAMAGAAARGVVGGDDARVRVDAAVRPQAAQHVLEAG